MTTIIILNVALLVVSAICFAISFIIPDKKPDESGIDQELAKEEVHAMVEHEKEALKEPLKAMAEEYASEAFSNASMELDEAVGEKIDQISEHSEQVLTQLRKEEQEAISLHQAVKEERESLDQTVDAAGKAAKSMKESVEKVQNMRPIEITVGDGNVKISPMATNTPADSEEAKKPETKES